MYVAFSDAALEAAVQVELDLGVVERARLARLQQLLLGGFDQVGSTLTVLDAQELPALEAVHLDSDARGHQGQEEDAKGSAPPLWQRANRRCRHGPIIATLRLTNMLENVVNRPKGFGHFARNILILQIVIIGC